MWQIPLNPQEASSPTLIGQPVKLGFLGLTNTGLNFFGPTEGSQPVAQAYGDPVYNNIMDDCGGHTAFQYHNHELVEVCFSLDGLVAEPALVSFTPGQEISPILGYAADGFPIYGSFEFKGGDSEQGIIEIKSSYQIKSGGNPISYAWDAYEYVEQNLPLEFMDECNGHKHSSNDQYHYHSTSEFPYIIGCFKGTPSSDVMGMSLASICSSPSRLARLADNK